MPRIARPSLMWSRVASGLGDEARVAERVGADEQAEPRPLGGRAQAASSRPALEDRLVRVAEDRVEVVPRPEVVVAEAVDPPGPPRASRPGRALAPEQDPELDVGHGWASGRCVALTATGVRRAARAGRLPTGSVARSRSMRSRSSLSRSPWAAAPLRLPRGSLAAVSPARTTPGPSPRTRAGRSQSTWPARPPRG